MNNDGCFFYKIKEAPGVLVMVCNLSNSMESEGSFLNFLGAKKVAKTRLGGEDFVFFPS